ncbi:MAG: 4Fe-4S binding protein [Myxococcota bacterium]
MNPQRLPLSKLLDAPFISLDETSIEMGSILFLFLCIVVITTSRRRRQLVRHLVQVASLVFFFFFVYSCLGVFGMIRNGLYGVSLIGSVYTEAFYWLALPTVVIASTLVAGPVFCGWVCPTGTIQELSVWVRQRVLPGKLRGTRVQLVLLGVALTSSVVIAITVSLSRELFVEDSSLHWAAILVLLCYLVVLGVLDDLPTRRLRLFSVVAIVVTAVSHVTITSPVHFAFTARDDPSSALTTVIIAAASFVVARSWCRYLCPWGFLMGWLSRWSRMRIVRRDDRCTQCNLCIERCDVGAIDVQHGVRAEQCQFCYACVDVCTESAFEVVDVWGIGTPREVAERCAAHRHSGSVCTCARATPAAER